MSGEQARLQRDCELVLGVGQAGTLERQRDLAPDRERKRSVVVREASLLVEGEDERAERPLSREQRDRGGCRGRTRAHARGRHESQGGLASRGTASSPRPLRRRRGRTRGRARGTSRRRRRARRRRPSSPVARAPPRTRPRSPPRPTPPRTVRSSPPVGPPFGAALARREAPRPRARPPGGSPGRTAPRPGRQREPGRQHAERWAERDPCGSTVSIVQVRPPAATVAVVASSSGAARAGHDAVSVGDPDTAPAGSWSRIARRNPSAEYPAATNPASARRRCSGVVTGS